MKALLHGCVDWRLIRDLAESDVRTVRQMGETETKNGAPLALAAAHFNVFITIDKNLFLQQNLTSLPIAVVVLRAKTDPLRDLRALIPALRQILPTLWRGELRILTERGSER
jgi:predicted nuclease of predicted toxin-antitoxin system